MRGEEAGAHGAAVGGNVHNRKSHRMKVVIVGGTHGHSRVLICRSHRQTSSIARGTWRREG